MSTTVLPQLREIESDLATQEEILTARLEELREQLRGVQAVMPMFEGAATSTVEAPVPTTEETIDTALPTIMSLVEEPTPEEAEQPAPKAKTKRKQTTSKKKANGRTASWQKYMRPGVKNESIPDAVRLILETQPENDFKIAEVMDVLEVLRYKKNNG